MIVGIGIDFIEVARILKALEAQPRFAERIFTPQEIRYCSGKRNRAQHLAARFAAKEAFFKALGRRIDWRSVWVVNLDSGQPLLEVRDRAGLGFDRAHVTLSHLKDYAQAVVVLERD